MADSIPIITIDGPSGTGKGTLGIRLAKTLGWHYLDSGAIYRSLAWVVLQQNQNLDDITQIEQQAQRLNLSFDEQKVPVGVMIDRQDCSLAIRTEECAKVASQLSALAPVRAALLQKQRQFVQSPGLVTDGRDMGTVVFPQASLKIFLTASANARAQRRYKQLKIKGESPDCQHVEQAINERDLRDSERAFSPLKPAADALIIETSSLNIDEVFAKVMQHVDDQFPAR